MIKTLFAYVRQYRLQTILTPLCTAGEVIMEVLIPLVMAKIIDTGIQAGNLVNVILFGLLMLFFAFLSLLSGAFAGKFGAEASCGFASNVRTALYDKIQTFSFSNIDRFSTAGLVTRMTTDVTNLQNAFQMCLRIAVRAPLMLVMCSVACVAINAQLSLIFVVAIAALAVPAFFLINFASKNFRKVFDKYDDLNASVQESITGIRVVKAFAREPYETEKFKNSAQNLYKLFVHVEGMMAIINPLVSLIVYGCIVALSWFGAHFVVGGAITTGNLTSLFTYVMQILMSLMMLAMIFVMLTMSQASAYRIAQVLDEEPDIVNPENPLYTVADGSIDIENMSFRYRAGDGDPVLKDINLHIASGETIGIVGGTGSGKTSLVSLLSRLYDVSSGSVKVGGQDVRTYDLETLRDAVSVVLQTNVLFSGTILDNLRWGNEKATEAQCREACRQACVDDFIQSLPDKYETMIERGGTNVSGGQKQRLCIARALLKKPRVLVLDDSTSAVDTATDARIRESFAKTIPGTTKLIISQRVSSVQDADKIVVLDEGRLSGFDTHENLLQTNDIYREMYEMQSAAGGDFDEHLKKDVLEPVAETAGDDVSAVPTDALKGGE